MDKNLIYGHHPVVEAIQSGKAVEKVYFQQGMRGELEKEIRLLSREYEIPLQIVPKEKLNKMVKGQHQGVVAYLSLITYLSLEDVVPFIFESGEVPLLVLLDGVTDVRNFGAICGVCSVRWSGYRNPVFKWWVLLFLTRPFRCSMPI